MNDYGKQSRMNILENMLNRDISELLKCHSWKYYIEKREDNGEYLLVKIEKNSTIKKFALLYSQSTDKIELSVGYEGKFRKHYKDHSGIVNAKYKF